MAYNPVGFHVAANNAGQGLAAYWQALDAAGIPFAVYSANDAGLIAAAARHKNATLIYRDVYASTVNPSDYATAPEIAAAGYWARTVASLPPGIVALKGRVWLELLNEPGREPAQAQWVGAIMAAMARRALAQGWRVMGPGYAPGNPEPESWQYPGWRDYLALCAANPDRVAVSVHEYALSNDIHAGENWLVGRFIHLFEACDAMGIARPNVYVTECGWTLNSAPSVEQMKNDIAWMSSLYARHPQIKSAHLWTMQGGRNNGDLPGKLNQIVPWLTEWTLRQRWPDPPTPPTEGAMILDLSRWNGTLNAAKMKAAGVAGVILRAAAGATRDTMVDTYAPALKAAGIPIVGAYLYYHPYEAWRPQLDALKAVMSKHGIRRGYLDLEDTKTVATLARDAETFMAALTAEMPLPAGKRHGIYTNVSYWRQMGAPAWGAAYDLWIAAWTEVSAPVVPAPWLRWTLWQYSNSGNGPAYGLQSARVDLNRFNGTAAAFSEWLNVVDVVDVPAAIRGAAAKQPGAGWHPTHALPMKILADGFYPISGEFNVPVGSMTYRALRAYDKTGVQFVYFAPVDQWHKTERIAL